MDGLLGWYFVSVDILYCDLYRSILLANRSECTTFNWLDTFMAKQPIELNVNFLFFFHFFLKLHSSMHINLIEFSILNLFSKRIFTIRLAIWQDKFAYLIQYQYYIHSEWMCFICLLFFFFLSHILNEFLLIFFFSFVTKILELMQITVFHPSFFTVFLLCFVDWYKYHSKMLIKSGIKDSSRAFGIESMNLICNYHIGMWSCESGTNTKLSTNLILLKCLSSYIWEKKNCNSLKCYTKKYNFALE